MSRTGTGEVPAPVIGVPVLAGSNPAAFKMIAWISGLPTVTY